MVRGLEKFKEYFAGYADKYILIGGAACTVLMEDAGLLFRATKDLDIVLCVEALDTEFVTAFWQFIKDGGYQNRQQSTGKKLFYRFYSPSDDTYPVILELFSRVPDILKLGDNSHLTPIPVDDEMSSLSAILLDEEYYRFIQEGRREIEGLPLIGAEHLIPLKVRAWLDMTALKEKGEAIQSNDIRKHRNDILRLYQLLSQDMRIELPELAKEDMKRFLERIVEEQIDLKGLGLGNIALDEVLKTLRQIYGLDR